MKSIRSLCFSAFRAGGLQSVLLRPSRHAGTGRVLVCSFASAGSAGAFAGRWARRVGGSIAVRRSAYGWSVSVPVSFPSSSWPLHTGRVLAVRGGLRGLVSYVGLVRFGGAVMVGFTGSRALGAQYRSLVSVVVGSLGFAGRGCRLC